MDRRVRVNKPEVIYYSSFLISMGNMFIAKSAKGVCRISFPCVTEEEFLYPFLKDASKKVWKNESVMKYETSILKEYFKGKQVEFNFPLDISNGTLFQKRVWKKIMEIPYGECRSYKWVAEQIENPLATRAVGLANNKNPLPPIIPCHRVIGSDGTLTGYAFGIHIKKQLLEMEFNAVNSSGSL